MKTLRFSLNVGTNDLPRLRLEKAYQAGDVDSFEDDHAALLLNESFVTEVEPPKHTAKHERKSKGETAATPSAPVTVET